MITIKSNHIFTKNGEVSGFISFDKKIKRISKNYQGDYLDYSDFTVIPGIIDCHNHGFLGWSITDPCSVKTIEGYVKALPSIGITGILPTITKMMTDNFYPISQVMHSNIKGATIHGIYSEGPFWARGGEKTRNEEYPLPDLEITKDFYKKASGDLRVMMLAPELPKAAECVNFLKNHSVLVACGHTKGNYEQIANATKEMHFDVATHLGNGMQGMHHRDVGALGALLLQDGLYYEIITDLNHICKEMLQIYFKLQPYDRFILISDGNYISGMPVGKYKRYGYTVTCDEKGLILNEDGRILGSGSWVLRNMGKLVNEVHVPMEEVVKMASLNPSIYLNIADKKGSLEVGKDSDIVIIDDKFDCVKTYISGECLFDRNVKKRYEYANLDALNNRVE